MRKVKKPSQTKNAIRKRAARALVKAGKSLPTIYTGPQDRIRPTEAIGCTGGRAASHAESRRRAYTQAMQDTAKETTAGNRLCGGGIPSPYFAPYDADRTLGYSGPTFD